MTYAVFVNMNGFLEVLRHPYHTPHPTSSIDSRLQLPQPHVKLADFVGDIGDRSIDSLLDIVKSNKDHPEPFAIRRILVKAAEEDEHLSGELATGSMGRDEGCTDGVHDGGRGHSIMGAELMISFDDIPLLAYSLCCSETP